MIQLTSHHRPVIIVTHQPVFQWTLTLHILIRWGCVHMHIHACIRYVNLYKHTIISLQADRLDVV